MGLLRWLFGREITREKAIRLATQFLTAEWHAYTAEWPAGQAEWPYDPPTARLGGNYWYVAFQLRAVDGMVRTDRGFEVWVHKKTGEVDHGDNICRRYFESLARSE